MLHSKRRAKTEPRRGQTRAEGPAKRQRVASPTRTGTKQEAVLDMLRQPQGATIAAIMKMTGWQQHSVRGFLAGAIKKRLRLKLDSTKADGIRIYRIVSGERGKAGPHKVEQQAR